MNNIGAIEKIKELLLAGKRAGALDIVYDYVDDWCLQISSNKDMADDANVINLINEFGKLLLENFNDVPILLSYLTVTRPWRNCLNRNEIIIYLKEIVTDPITLSMLDGI